jgi:UDPglucose--hexose-1-phosphate uridylyltransferase
MMFSTDRVTQPESFIEYRTESLTGIRTRICPQRLLRGIGTADILHYSSEGCPFCPDMIESVTPTFPDGERIHVGESVTFPNLYPFAAYHVVTAITREHRVLAFAPSQIADALLGQVQALANHEGYPSINWNYLPSAGASLPHPHLQGLCDITADTLPSRYLDGCQRYLQSTGRRYADDLVEFETDHGRNLIGLRLFWYVHPVPIGEREIRCILPLVTVSEFSEVVENFSHDIVQILNLYRDLGTSAFNMSIFFGTEKDRDSFSAFCSIISRINPNPLSTSDTAFMERLHLEPVILTLPEDLAEYWRDLKQVTLGKKE